MKGSKNAMDARTGNIKLAAMLKDKGLNARPDKTCYIGCGSKQFKETVDKDFKANPVMFDKFSVKQKVSDKYLGHGRSREECHCNSSGEVRENKGSKSGDKSNCGRVPDAINWWSHGYS